MTVRTINTLIFSFLLLFHFNHHAFAETLNWVGCGISKKSYLTQLAEEYTKARDIEFNIQGGGATKGIREVANGNSDLGGSCRFHLPGDESESRIGFEPVAWDALAIITHPDNPVDNLTLDQVKAIYTGKLTNWKELGGPDMPINLFARNGNISGVGYSIRSLIFSDVTMTFHASKLFKSSGPLEKAVQSTPGSIAITGISSARLRDVKIMSLNNKQPDYKTIKSGQYVLYRPLYITYDPSSDKISQLRDFIKFAHSRKGKSIMRENGVVPYLDALRLVMIQSRESLKSQNSSDENLTYN